jgi:integrase
VLDWMEGHSRPVADLADPDVTHAALATLSRRIDGRPAAANTIVRRRQVFNMVCQYAIARGDLTANPLAAATWKPPKNVAVVDRRAVVNPQQAAALLAAVDEIAPDLTAFFAGFYYQAFRPGENQELRGDQLMLPDSGWGEALLIGNNPEISPRWSDTPEAGRQVRPLKHRAVGEFRPVPLNPRYVALVRRHIDRFGLAPDGRIFRTSQDGPIKATRYRAVWAKARLKALTPAEFASPLARRPYDLRHAAVSTWLNAGVPPTQVAEWAGHSVRVLLTVYAKCIVGQDEIAKRRIDAALSSSAETTHDPALAEREPIHGSSTPQPQPARNDRTRPDLDGPQPADTPGPDLGGSWI